MSEQSVTTWLGWIVAAITIAGGTVFLLRSRDEREKLKLEIARLRNSPEVVADRRAIYERLRAVLGAIIATGHSEIPQISELHAVRHDAAFRFPDDVLGPVGLLIDNAVQLHVSGEVMLMLSDGRDVQGMPDAVDRNDRALRAILEFENGMVTLFRPFLRL